MNSNDRTLDMEPDWDAVDSVDDWIECADMAVLGGPTGQQCVTLVHERNEQGTFKGKALTYREGKGLHYDGDEAISGAFLQECILSKGRGLTKEWAVCEEFLTSDTTDR